ncbi:Alpha-tubulin N-acetyltransferase 1 [Entomortierella beljakovae]|nr:Alpha-tubulin N-acetyltransferase 1 [Entomortierella beljakovae]
MDFDFPLIPLLPLPITLVPAATFAALENNQHQIQQAYASSVSIGLSKNTSGNSSSLSNSSTSSSLAALSNSNGQSSSTSTSTSAPYTATSPANSLSDQERLGAIVDALGKASAKAQELPTSITQTLRLAKNPTQRVYILRTGLESGEDQWSDQLEIGSPLMMESIKRSLLELNTGSSSITTATFYSNSQHNEHNEHNDSELSIVMSLQENASKKSIRSRSEEKGVYVAGMLKIGEKKLFIVDKEGTIHEQEACCVLDFYVDSSCQRRGYGKLLFDYMLKVEGIEPNQIAYDRPSPKLYGFLSKYFQLERHVPQPNMFAIFEGFKLQDSGETIQVDDDDFSPIGRHTSSASSTSPTDNTPGNNIINANGGSPVKPVVSRALQSSVVFSSSAPLDSNNLSVSGSLNQQAGRRVSSSAFSSSINLSGPSSVNNSNFNNVTTNGFSSTQSSSAGCNSTNTTGFSLSSNTTRHNPVAPPTQRVSRLLTSSIVFADPTVSD